jgi:transglutaminase-like putative cysteine protease
MQGWQPVTETYGFFCFFTDKTVTITANLSKDRDAKLEGLTARMAASYRREFYTMTATNKVTRALLAAIVLMLAVPAIAFANPENSDSVLDKSRLDKGAIGIRYEVKKTTKVKIVKDSVDYTYTLNASANGKTEWFPLQMGNGKYEIGLFENVSGKKYKVLLTEKLNVEVSDAPAVYLNAVQYVDWKKANKATAKAKLLTKTSKTDEQKAKAIYKYIVDNVKYDNDLALSVQSDYVPDINETLISGKAICYGYATLYAAMLRSEGIPAKLVMGTTKLVNGYHAWNEVYLNGKWVVVDATVDAGLVKSSKKGVFKKKAGDYTVAKVY